MSSPITKILIVDDNEDILDTFQEFFKIMGYRVSIAQNVITAIKKLKTNVIAHIEQVIFDKK